MNCNIRLIYIHGVFTQMLFLLPVIVPYYNSIGLTFRDFLLGEAFFSVVVLVMEVPSGWMSDLWKRRSTLVLGGFSGICGLGLLMIAEDFWTATIAQGIIGIAVALNSGTNTALLYDTLHEHDAAGEYVRTDGKRHGFGIYGTAFSCLAGGFLFHLHPKLPLMVDMLVLLVAMIAISGIREPVRHMKSVEKHIFRDMWETVKYALSGHPEITGIIMVSTVMLCTTKLLLWAQQPYYEMLDIPVAWFGVIMAGMYVCGGVAGQNAHLLERWKRNWQILAVMIAGLGIACFALTINHSSVVAVVLFLTGTLCYATGTPRINNAINRRVGPERRATILSTASLMVHFLFIPSSMVVGWLSEQGGILLSLQYTGAQVLILGAIGLLLWRKSTAKVPA